jgi:hypothetical protein
MSAVVFYGNGSVWDAAKNRVLCRFVDGKYETKDPREIGILAEQFEHDISQSADQEVDNMPEVKRRGRRSKNA